MSYSSKRSATGQPAKSRRWSCAAASPATIRPLRGGPRETSGRLPTRLCLGRGGSSWRTPARAGTREGKDFLGVKWLAAFRANQHGVEDFFAFSMLMYQRPPAPLDHIGIAP